jgi:myo-inositol 2-dehydrogenase/D-chiro-inositol 1-dehydrogenase
MKELHLSGPTTESPTPEKPSAITRRRFLGGTLTAAATSSLVSLTSVGVAQTPDAPPAEFKRKIKLGIVGNGIRGGWIAKLFQKHGGYEMHAIADYFPEVADQCGGALGVDTSRRFSTLSGYKRLLESGVEAVALQVPPYFFPDQALAAVEAGMHVYMAKPVAPDVPGCVQVLATGKKATQKGLCFLVDYQMPTDPGIIEVLRRIHDPSFGPIAQIATFGIRRDEIKDPEKGTTIENRLRQEIWVNDVAMGCDYIGNYDIHAIDAALWAAGRRPVSAMGSSRICRANPHGDSRDVCSVIFEYSDGLVHNHFGQALENHIKEESLDCAVYGRSANAFLSYTGTAQFRSFDDGYSKKVENLYEAGAVRNIATFYRNVTTGNFTNDTVQPAVDSALTCILGREAAARRASLTMEQLLKENVKLEVDLSGLKT